MLKQACVTIRVQKQAKYTVVSCYWEGRQHAAATDWTDSRRGGGWTVTDACTFPDIYWMQGLQAGVVTLMLS